MKLGRKGAAGIGGGGILTPMKSYVKLWRLPMLIFSPPPPTSAQNFSKPLDSYAKLKARFNSVALLIQELTFASVHLVVALSL